MPQSSHRWIIILIGLVFLLLVSIPFLYAWGAAGKGEIFGGFLFNPLDGNTYLAKIHAGYTGHWRYTFPYTAGSSEGGYLFTFYLTLGHLARFMRLKPLTIFHLARLVSAIVLLLALYRFYQLTLPSARTARLSWIMAVLGSGLGWLALPFGMISMDMWVAEAYPFLSAYANPHFPLSLTLLCILITGHLTRQSKPTKDTLTSNWRVALGAGIAAVLLGILSPFGVIVGIALLACMAGLAEIAWRDRLTAKRWLSRAVGAALGGFPILAYDYWLTTSDPIIAGWNAQNLTPSAPVSDLLISFSPYLLFSLIGILGVLRWITNKPASPNLLTNTAQLQLLLVWAGLGIVIAYIPLGLQRRFLLGLLVPLAGIASVFIIRWWDAQKPRWIRLALVGLLVLAFPTNLMIIFTSFHGVKTHEPIFFLNQDEMLAFEWMDSSTPQEAVVLAAPQTGMFLPAYTGKRVVYGHPFETVNAEEKQAEVTYFYSGQMNPNEVGEFLLENQVTFIFCGPREKALGGWIPDSLAEPVFEQGEVVIYRYNNPMVAARTWE